MFSKRGIERLAGALLVASFAAFLGHLVTFTLEAVSATILLVLVYGFLIFLSAAALYLTFRPHEQTLALFSASALAAHALFVVLVCAMILVHFKLAEEFAEADAAVAAVRALKLTLEKIQSSAFVFLGLSFVPLGVLIAWSGAVARWVGWLGVVVGTLGFLAMLARLFDIPEGGGAATLVSLAPLFGFILILGIRLLVRETRAATVEAVGVAM